MLLYLSIYLSGLVTAVAVFRKPNTIPYCLATDLLLNVLFSIMRLYTVHYISVDCSTCFGWLFHTSSGVHITVNIASGTATFRYREAVGTAFQAVGTAFQAVGTAFQAVGTAFQAVGTAFHLLHDSRR